jgi:hypothetical protein
MEIWFLQKMHQFEWLNNNVSDLVRMFSYDIWIIPDYEDNLSVDPQVMDEERDQSPMG